MSTLQKSFAAVAAFAVALSAVPKASAETPELVALRDDHIHRQQAILGYLTGAAGLSLAAGTALWFVDPPPFAGKAKEFRQSFAALCLVYGALNTAFVAANFAGLEKQPTVLGSASLLEQDRLRQTRAFAANAGLDMIYITLGFTLSATDSRPIVQGMGAGIAVQGGFLLGFDGAGALAMSR